MPDSTSSPSSKSLLIPSVLAFGIPLVLILGVLMVARSGPVPAPSPDEERSIAQRIQKVGSVTVVEASRDPLTGEQVFNARCSACHATGANNAPKFQDNSAWAPRIKQGFETLINSALKGKNLMPPQGGSDLSELEIARGVAYMANAAGAKFTEPASPAKTAP
ncbi:cytochrome c5 family protein [Curvibacter sp. CHRR-16]|uniref:c-type cytochrome n=1 Tax=Curvibacter sp. CHRR-16 TaxID=2835872 RepID=UPI001BDA0400|nr:c-type cytochrome [Curvibacter sp. CHRR-16]MBT0571821.1 cytochrome c5 family protein [Curvibacter sp. CHRR-16]